MCQKSVLFEYQKLSNHLFFNHAIGIAKYKDFLQGKVSLESLVNTDQNSNKSKSNKTNDNSSDPSGSVNRKRRKRKPTPGPSSRNLQPSGYQNPFLQQNPIGLALMQMCQTNPALIQTNPFLLQQTLSLAALNAEALNALIFTQAMSAQNLISQQKSSMGKAEEGSGNISGANTFTNSTTSHLKPALQKQ